MNLPPNFFIIEKFSIFPPYKIILQLCKAYTSEQNLPHTQLC